MLFEIEYRQENVIRKDMKSLHMAQGGNGTIRRINLRRRGAKRI